jgi:hypothetical protein
LNLPARVKAGNHVFGECSLAADSHRLLLGGAVIIHVPEFLVIGIASFLHCIEWDDYINRHYVD